MALNPLIALYLQELAAHTTPQPDYLLRDLYTNLKRILKPEQVPKARQIIIDLAGSAAKGAPLYVACIAHVCKASSCALEHCLLCKNAVLRPCVTALAPNYVDNKVIETRCGGPLCIYVFRIGSNSPLTAEEVAKELPGVLFEVRILWLGANLHRLLEM
jgi:hypothetical protein